MNHIGKYFLLALIIIVLDQATKLWVYYNMDMGVAGQIKIIGNWVKIHYTLNPGMAFGLRIGFKYGKLLLTVCRILAAILISQYMWRLARAVHQSSLLLSGWAMVLGGAIGNVVDSVFYAVFLDNAPAGAPMKWFYGQVIDMIYVDIWETQVPHWVPWLGSKHLSFFPIFNLADVAIFLGIAAIILSTGLADNIEEQPVPMY